MLRCAAQVVIVGGVQVLSIVQLCSSAMIRHSHTVTPKSHLL